MLIPVSKLPQGVCLETPVIPMATNPLIILLNRWMALKLALLGVTFLLLVCYELVEKSLSTADT